MHRGIMRFAGVLVLTTGIGLIPGQSARAQSPGAGQVGQQLRFVQFLLGAQAGQIQAQERRLAQEQAFVARIDSITQRIPANFRQARQALSIFNQARGLLARFQAQTRQGNLGLLRRQARIAALLERLGGLLPGDERLARFSQLFEAQSSLVTRVVTATPAAPLAPVPFLGA